jgi:hypothetical protein
LGLLGEGGQVQETHAEIFGCHMDTFMKCLNVPFDTKFENRVSILFLDRSTFVPQVSGIKEIWVYINFIPTFDFNLHFKFGFSIGSPPICELVDPLLKDIPKDKML